MRSAIFAAGLSLLVLPHAARGHEFMVLPVSADAPSRGMASVDLTMTETWIQADRVPPQDMVALERVDEEGRVAVPFSPVAKALRATVSVSGKPFLMAGRMRRDRLETPRSSKEDERPEARMTRSETFSKVYVDLTEKSNLWSQPVGTRLEIVPLANPALLKQGNIFAVQILFEGVPVASRVQAAFDGKGAEGHGFAVRTESGADGVARIALTRPGRWLIRARHSLDEARDGYVHYAGSANLVFEVE
ncbi:MAG: DUF4198 domain-containing protein [Sphingobium sp.]